MEATAALERDDFDLVASDVRMPHMNGVELLEWVRANRREHLPRLMFMTGDGSGAGLNGAIRGAGRPLLRKPIAVAELMALPNASRERPVVPACRHSRPSNPH